MTAPASRGLLRRNRQFARLLAGQVPADFADWLSYVAMMTLIAFQWEAPTIAFAWFAVALGLPYLTIGLLAGALVDRLPVRAVLVGANLGRGLVYLSMTLAGDWVTLVALLALGQSVDTFFTPAKQAALQRLVAEPDRLAANSVSHAVNQSSKIVAPALGAVLLGWLAPGGVFVVNAAISGLAALILMTLPPLGQAPLEGPRPALRADIAAGLRLVRRSPPLRLALGLTAASFFATFLYDTLLAALIRDLGHPAAALGWAMAAFGVGGVAGALWLARRTGAPFRLMGLGGLVAGPVLILPGLAQVFGVPFPLAPMLLAFALGGVASAALMIPPRVVIQNETAPESIARVTALGEAANTAALVTAPFLGAAIAAATSTGIVFVLGGSLTLAIAAVALTRARRA
ncbi:hypothetical protein OG2516_09003 [Oceanicola granulosus HTCC2516]|uniref:Major facilitator superfamily (MFS) profile domain-containing protein n=1 Tax=Oceanicola granulosus (strain ATCC BAA-861 / DSM 15982 / KCTC 12143 / HTCC2516) TaxID=314256 RepID=Q2CCP9_OCEGH|nr:MFS transporter [Oceanicola granulosus]EAR50464.1 hypothetical protein OG2516_09003 [Oceanicola granulosus HTCC2516]